jgi:hypothetical protein
MILPDSGMSIQHTQGGLLAHELLQKQRQHNVLHNVAKIASVIYMAVVHVFSCLLKAL